MALCEYAEKLTRDPASVGSEDITRLRAAGLAEVGSGDIEKLRDAGFDDRGISSGTQVIAYFNYINRIAEGLGVPMEAWLNDDGTTKRA